MPATLQLTQRDESLLLALYKHRYLSVSQVQRLYFPSPQTTTRRLRLLTKAGFVETFTPLGISERVATLSSIGARVVAGLLSITREELRWKPRRRQPHDYLFFKHFLATTDFWLSLDLATCLYRSVQLLDFIPEQLGTTTNGSRPQKYITDSAPDPDAPGAMIRHTPDAVFALRKLDSTALFFLETDRGTEEISHLHRGVMKLLRFYLSYLLSDGYQRYRQDFDSDRFKGFRVLFVTSSKQRIQNIRQVATTLTVGDRAKRFIWLTTQDQVNKETVLSDIWNSLELTDEKRYAILS